MLRVLRARALQKKRTMRYPYGPAPALPERFAGRPVIDASLCTQSKCEGAAPCLEACPVGALTMNGEVTIDLGACLFCRACERACRHGAITFTNDHRLGAASREELLVKPGAIVHAAAPAIPARFKRSFRIRQVSAGGCNACEADANVLTTIGWDLSRFGIGFVASPRHADAILVTGPVTENMRLALEKTWAAVPEPRFIIAMGSCAIAGGPYRGHAEANDGVATILPVDLYIPGCPPHPLTVLESLLWFLGRTLR